MKNKKLKGVIRVHPRGFGFFQADEGEVFIPRGALASAVDGDTVEIKVVGQREKGPEGEVIQVIKRARSGVACIVSWTGKGAPTVAHAPLLGTERKVVVHHPRKKLKVGDRILVAVDDWDEDSVEGTLKKVIGHIDDPSVDIKAACLEFELRTKFPKKAIEEAEKFSKKVPTKGREDLREVPTVTIDPETAKDFDDALSLCKKKDGYELMVHIADVSHYVTRGSALDEEAYARCNSTYFPGVCVPMLPEALSNELCSLKPKVDRLAVTVIMQFDRNANIKDYRITRSVIHSDKRFSYEEAKEILDGKKDPHSALLKLMVELCEKLKIKRRERGSVEFGLPEISLQVDEKGVPTGTRLIEYDITHQLVEEFMLKANETVAKHLANMKRGLTYRVHEAPSDADLEAFFQMAQAFGHRIPSRPTMQDIQKLFDEAKGNPYLAVAFIRSMKMATYSPDNIGHYGLSLEHYCHFTSPIRRYSDLLVHRVIFNSETEDEIAEIARRCSDQERLSARAEGSVTHLKKLRYLKAAKTNEWKAVISAVKPVGVVFQLVDLMLEGFIHISEIGDDYYESNGTRLRGRHTGETLTCGTEIEVRALDIDLITKEVMWERYA